MRFASTGTSAMGNTAFVLLVGLVVSVPATAGELANLHAERMSFGGTVGRPRPPEQIERTDHGIMEIGIEKTECFGDCQAYEARIRSDGTLVWRGHANVKRMGHRTGRVSQAMFHQIAILMRDSGFMKWADDYTLPVTDHQSVYTLVVAEKRSKIIRNYANAGPSQLWAIEQLIEKMLVQATWNE